MRHWITRDFASARGENVIHRWLHDLPPAARFEINNRITFLEGYGQLARPYAAPLKGSCKGLFEIRVRVQNVQYRPLAFRGPQSGELTLLVGAIERGGEFEPETACSIAFNRIELLNTGGGTTVVHDFS